MTQLERWERRTGPWLTGLALLSFVVLVVDSLLEAEPPIVRILDYAAWATFAADYAVRILLADARWSFVRSHPLDLAAVALPALRVLRLVASLARVAALARRGVTERVLVTTTLIATALIIGGAATALDAERSAEQANIISYADALWWATTTVTTVGYGDRFPVTAEGRLVGVVLMIVGIAVFGSITAALASRLIQESDHESEASARVQELEESVRRLSIALDRLTATKDHHADRQANPYTGEQRRDGPRGGSSTTP